MRCIAFSFYRLEFPLLGAYRAIERVFYYQDGLAWNEHGRDREYE
jgi:hypothetical protein